MDFEEFKSKKFKCEIEGCNAQFDRPNRLNRHQLTHSNIVSIFYPIEISLYLLFNIHIEYLIHKVSLFSETICMCRRWM